MPQFDLQTLATASTDHDHKLARPTLVEGDATKNDVITDGHADDDGEPDFPPESFWISKDAEYDWFNRNALYERKESTRGNSSSINTNQSINNSNSQRSLVKSAASIIGLPKTQRNGFLDSKWRTYKVVNTKLFPKRGKSTVPMAEPGSPKVSCIGRVRSKRSRRRSNSLKAKESAARLRTGAEKPESDFCCNVMSIFRLKKWYKKPDRSGSGKVVEVPGDATEVVEPRRERLSAEAREIVSRGEIAVEPPGLGSVTRLASGRRSGNWVAEEINQSI